MKVIQVVGRSNSGKTTFIKNLIPELRKYGKVAVIKHLGDHDYLLEEGKDTTVFYNAGADITVGIDANKTVIAVHNNQLDDTLRVLSFQRMDYAIIEGYKQRSFPKIVIGNLAVDGCILHDPTVDEVINSLHHFEDFQD